MKVFERERRDWILIIFILPIGMMLMYLAGQQAIQVLSTWSVNADMASHLLPNDQYAGRQVAGIIEPLRAEIGTPAAWMGTFLTPHPGQADASQTPAPLVVFDPSATPSPSLSPTATATTSSTSTITLTVTGTPPTATATVTKTKTPKPTTTSTATSTATGTASPSPTSPPATIDPSLTPISPPAGANVGAPDGSIADIPNTTSGGTYFLLDVSGNPVIVTDPSETDYDLIYYEFNSGGNVLMDQVIVGITNDTLWLTYDYYEVFNWGDNMPDTNTNVDTTTLADPPSDPANPEADNEPIATTNLYGSSPTQTGILIDVDNAPSAPPPGSYNYVVVISPVVAPQSPPSPAEDTSAQVDSVEVTEVPNP